MGGLQGRVAVITGAGRGLGREYALLFAAEGACVVVNDLGGTPSGEGTDRSVAQGVVDEIVAMGGQAVANTDSITSLDGSDALVRSAVEAFGDLHVLVNNAGILRDRMLVNMSEEEFDAVVDVHMKGTFCPMRQAAAYWRRQAKAGEKLSSSIINTSSSSGLFNRPGQVNYGGAKSAIAAMTMIAAKELKGYGVRVNAIAPGARTRLTLQTPGLEDRMALPDDPTPFDEWDPANIAPMVAYLATESCPFSGAVFRVTGGDVDVLGGWSVLDTVSKPGRWTVAELAAATERFIGDDAKEAGWLLSELYKRN